MKTTHAFRSIGAALALGFVLFFFSETMFWGRPNRAPVPELVISWIAYCVLAGLMLYALTLYHVQTWSALFLCGALYGWLAEGVLAGTVYDALPIQISWTGLAWHASLSFCAGWYGLHSALRHSTVRTAGLASLLGVFWGVWAVMWWQPQEGAYVTPLTDFALHAVLNGVLLIVAFAMLPRLMYAGAYTSRRGLVVLILIAALWFAVVIVPQQPLALVIAPLLGITTLLALRRGRRQLPFGTEMPVNLWGSFSLLHCAALMAMPAAAVLIYALFLQIGRPLATNIPIFWVLTPLGFLLYGVSFWQNWKAARTSNEHAIAPS